MRVTELVTLALLLVFISFMAYNAEKNDTDIEISKTDKQLHDFLQYRFDTLETKIEQMELQVKLTADESGDCSLVTVKEIK